MGLGTPLVGSALYTEAPWLMPRSIKNPNLRIWLKRTSFNQVAFFELTTHVGSEDSGAGLWFNEFYLLSQPYYWVRRFHSSSLVWFYCSSLFRLLVRIHKLRLSQKLKLMYKQDYFMSNLLYLSLRSLESRNRQGGFRPCLRNSASILHHFFPVLGFCTFPNRMHL